MSICSSSSFLLVVALLFDGESTPNPTGYRPPQLNACLNPGQTAIQCPLSTPTDHRDLTHVDVKANRGDVLCRFVLPCSFLFFPEPPSSSLSFSGSPLRIPFSRIDGNRLFHLLCNPEGSLLPRFVGNILLSFLRRAETGGEEEFNTTGPREAKKFSRVE